MENSIVDTVVSVRRVTKVTKGGKRFTFSAFVVSGDKQGKIGFASFFFLKEPQVLMK